MPCVPRGHNQYDVSELFDGMWNEFNEETWQSQHLNTLNGLEICHYPNVGSLNAVQAFCEKHGYGYGIQADYILVHYPFLPIYSPPLRTAFRKMSVAGERYEYGEISEKQFREYSIQLFDKLCLLQERCQQRILLEHDFFGSYGEVFIEMFKQYPEIKLVVDTARLDVTARAFHVFNPYEWLEKLAPHVYLVHYSNARYEGDHFVHHLPVQQEQDDDPQYGDSYSYLSFLAARNRQFHLTFEHKADIISRDELYNVYQRVARLLEIVH